MLRLRPHILAGLVCLHGSVSWGADSGRVADWGACAVEPPPPLEYPAATATEDELEIFSGKAEFRLDGDARFTNDIVLRAGERTLRADSAAYEKSTGVFRVSGEVEYRDPQTRVVASNAELDRLARLLSFEDAGFELWSVPARGSAASIRVDQDNGKVKLKDATYTSCPAGNNDWQLRASQIRIDQRSGIGTAKGARLDFKGVPIMYLPYISYPVTNQRKTGFLIPDLGRSNARGFDIATPYYWNIAPNYDATFTPRYMSRRGLQGIGEFRYLLRDHKGVLDGEYLNSDDITGEDRSLVAWFSQSQLSRNWRGTLDFTSVSDPDYFRDLSSGNATTSQTNLDRSLRFEYFAAPWSAMFRVQHYQILDEAITADEKPYKRLPQLAVRGASPRGLFGLRYEFVGDATWFDRDVGVTGLRTHLAPEVGLPLRFPWFDLEAAAAYRYTTYELRDTAPGEADNPDYGAPVYSLDVKQTFERLTNNVKWLQTLEPRALFTYIPFEEQGDLPVFDTIEPDLNIVQLFRQNRFAGYDRLGDTKQVALGITTRVLEAESGKEFLRATVGNIRYFSDQEVTLPGGAPTDANSSDYLAEVGARIYDDWRMNLGYQWDSDQNESILAEARVLYNPDPSRIANLAYRFRRDSLEEIDVALAWPILDNWSFVGRYNYSLQDNEPLERFAGLEYETCCWGIRAVWRRYLTSPNVDGVTSASDTSISIQLILKGFSSVGNSADRLLDRGILGYD